MVLEIGDISVAPGSEQEFVTAYRQARELVAGTAGCLSVRMTQGIETPARFVLLVEWESVEAHEVNFRQSERFAAWRGLIGPYFVRPPQVEHFVDV